MDAQHYDSLSGPAQINSRTENKLIVNNQYSLSSEESNACVFNTYSCLAHSQGIIEIAGSCSFDFVHSIEFSQHFVHIIGVSFIVPPTRTRIASIIL